MAKRKRRKISSADTAFRLLSAAGLLVLPVINLYKIICGFVTLHYENGLSVKLALYRIIIGAYKISPVYLFTDLLSLAFFSTAVFIVITVFLQKKR